MSTCRKMPKHAAHATLERERTRSRIVDDEPAPPAALEECLGVLPLGDDDDLATFDLFRPDGVVSAIDVEGLPDEDAVALGCEAQAMAEGLTLVSSTNACGFKGVSYLGLTKDNRYVGNFATAAEGALCYARGTAATATAANTATTHHLRARKGERARRAAGQGAPAGEAAQARRRRRCRHRHRHEGFKGAKSFKARLDGAVAQAKRRGEGPLALVVRGRDGWRPGVQPKLGEPVRLGLLRSNLGHNEPGVSHAEGCPAGG